MGISLWYNNRNNIFDRHNYIPICRFRCIVQIYTSYGNLQMDDIKHHVLELSIRFDIVHYKPITLFPFYMGMATGPTQIFGSYGGFVQLEATIFIYNHNAFSLFICLVYRYSNALPIDGNYLLGKKWHIVALLGLAYAFVILHICLIILSRVDPEVLKEILKNEVKFKGLHIFSCILETGRFFFADPPPHKWVVCIFGEGIGCRSGLS